MLSKNDALKHVALIFIQQFFKWKFIIQIILYNIRCIIVKIFE